MTSMNGQRILDYPRTKNQWRLWTDREFSIIQGPSIRDVYERTENSRLSKNQESMTSMNGQRILDYPRTKHPWRLWTDTEFSIIQEPSIHDVYERTENRLKATKKLFGKLKRTGGGDRVLLNVRLRVWSKCFLSFSWYPGVMGFG